ncbi:MAG: hypothetical protein N3J91_04620 [Verrucomicrobiae bacterium]|nr:hypothetical protein [Verrucomicrobiae bacterium]
MPRWLHALLIAFAVSSGLEAAKAAAALVESPWLISRQGWRLVDAQGQPVTLRNNPQARDVPFQQVLAFVQSNQVNQLPYRTGQFACTEFAVALHNAAEAAGIRCALVGVRFQRGPGHALNAFQTTDKGLVYIDCTGSPNPPADPARFDTIGYLKLGQPYGRLPLELGAIEPNRYERYTYVMGLWRWVQMESRQLKAAGMPDAPEELALSPAERAERRARLRAQLQRLQMRYDMNPSPVKTIDVWW